MYNDKRGIKIGIELEFLLSNKYTLKECIDFFSRKLRKVINTQVYYSNKILQKRKDVFTIVKEPDIDDFIGYEIVTPIMLWNEKEIKEILKRLFEAIKIVGKCNERTALHFHISENNNLKLDTKLLLNDLKKIEEFKNYKEENNIKNILLLEDLPYRNPYYNIHIVDFPNHIELKLFRGKYINKTANYYINFLKKFLELYERKLQ